MQELRKRSDQWDIRMNVGDEDDVSALLKRVQRLYETGQVRYVHVSGVEVGDVPGRTSYGKRHVHIACVLHNYTTKSSMLTKFVAGRRELGYYVEPRDKTKPLEGWLQYHKKRRTKLDPDVPLLLQRGEFPRIREPKDPDCSKQSERQKIRYQEWQRRKYLIAMMDFDQLDVEFPGFIWTAAGQNMKREILKQSNDEYCRPLQGELKNYIVWGPSGTGKSSSVALLYPSCYKKQKGTQYWDGYDKTNPDHEVVWIDEMSKETLATLTGKIDGGFEFLKELGDRYPVTVDEKYTKGYKIRPKTVIITMNEHPTSLLPDRAIEINKKALYRKFKILYVQDWLALNGLECTPEGCRRMDISHFDYKPESEEVKQEHEFNQQRSHQRDASSEESVRGSDSSDQNSQASAATTVSEILSDQGRSG